MNLFIKNGRTKVARGNSDERGNSEERGEGDRKSD